jgi:hypothetical protein
MPGLPQVWGRWKTRESHLALGGIVRVLAALGLTPMRVPSTWSAITRSWLSASAVRCVGRAGCMRYRPG